MAFDSYDDLVGAIEDELSRGDLREVIPSWLRLVEVEVERDVQLRPLEKVDRSRTLSTVNDWIELPKDLIELRYIRINTNPIRELQLVSQSKLAGFVNTSQSNYPIAASHIGNRLYVAPTSTAAEELTIVYWAKLTPLSKDNPTNAILERAPDVYFYGALKHSAPYVGDDPRLATWMQLYGEAKASFRRQEWRGRTGVGHLRIRPDFSIDDRHNVGGR